MLYFPRYQSEEYLRPAAKAIGRAVQRGFEKIKAPFTYQVRFGEDGIRVSVHGPSFFDGPVKTHRQARMIYGIIPHVEKVVRRARRAAGYRADVLIDLNPWAPHDSTDWRWNIPAA